jgi:pimeloyl-ACP methyl ester carboxylesterase
VSALDAQARRDLTPCPGGAMVWRTWGHGPPLVLLHGASGSWTHWLRNIPALAGRFSVIVPDLPGFGDSDAPPEPHTVEVLADAVVRGLDAVAPSAIELAGFSFGGIVAGHVAARLGRRVRALVLFGAGGLGLPRAPTRPLVPLRPGMTPDEIERAHRENLGIVMIADPARVDGLAMALQIENLARARFRSGDIPTSDALLRALPSITARLVAIYSTRDAFVGPTLDERRRLLTGLRPDIEFRVLEGPGHWAIYEAADRATAVLLDGLRPAEAAGPGPTPAAAV